MSDKTHTREKKLLKFDSGAKGFERAVVFLIFLALAFLLFGIYFFRTL